MCSTKGSFFKTVTFRAAFYYFCLFSLSLIAIFIVIYLLLNRYIIDSIDNELDTLTTRFEKAYSGKLHHELLEAETANPANIPQHLLGPAKNAVPGALIYRCEPIQGDKKQLYEVEAVKDEIEYGILLDSQGHLLGIEKEPFVKGAPALKKEFEEWRRNLGRANVFFCLVSGKDHILISSDSTGFPVPVQQLRQQLAGQFAQKRSPYRHTVYSSTHLLRISCRPLPDGNSIVIVYYMERERRLLLNYLNTISISFIIMLFGSALGAYGVAFRAMKGVKRVATMADQITHSNINCSVPVMNEGTEVSVLVHSFNRMLARISTLIQELTTVTNSLAHDLKTPVTALRARLESHLIHEKPVMPDAAEAMVNDCDMIIEMLNTTLETAELSAGIAELEQEEVNLSDILVSAHDLFKPVTEDKGLELSLSLPADPIHIICNKQKLQRVIANLLDNAIKYTERGFVALKAAQTEQDIHISVTDTGCGIATDELARVCEKFYRCDRSRATQGYGLGLSYVKAVADLCHWQLSISSELSEGTVVEITCLI